MAATFKQRIEAIAGSIVGIEAQVAQWLLDGFHLVVGIAPVHVLMQLADIQNAATLTIENSRLVAARHPTSKQLLTEIPASRALQATVSGSVWEATADFPVFYRAGGMVVPIPAGNTDWFVIATPAIADTDQSIASLPHDFERAVELYATIQKVTYDLAQIHAVVTLEAPPALPTFPTINLAITAGTTFTFTAPTAPTPPTPPVLTPPTWDGTAPTPPTVPSLDLSTEIDGITAIVAPSWSSVTPIVVPDLDLLTGITPPTWTPPTRPADAIIDDPTIADLAISATIDALKEPGTPPAVGAANTGTAATVTDVTIGAIPTAPVYTPPTVDISATLASFDPRITDDDPDMVAAVAQKAVQELSKIGLDIQNGLNTFNANNAKFQADVQKVLQQAEITLRDEIETARMATDVSVRNAAEQNAIVLQEYAGKVQRYQAEIARYQAAVNAEVTEYVTNEIQMEIAKWSRQSINYLERYESDIQAERSKFISGMESFSGQIDQKLKDHTGEWQLKLAEYQAEVEAEAARMSTELNLFNSLIDQKLKDYTGEWELKIRAYQAQVQGYVGEAQAFSAEVAAFRAQIDKYLGEVQGYQAEVQGFAAEVQSAVAAWQDDQASHRAELEETIQVAQTQLAEHAQELAARAQDIQDDLNAFQTTLEDRQLRQSQLMAKRQVLAADLNMHLQVISTGAIVA